MADRDEPSPCKSRRAFAASCLGVLSVASSVALGGCSFSLRDFLLSPTRFPGFSDVDQGGPARENSVEADAEPAGGRVSEAEQRGFWFDSETCVGCSSCVAACLEANGTPEGQEGRRRLLRYELDGGACRCVSLSCLHCAEPACARACPSAAVLKRADGVVAVDAALCIGCRYCRQACPFDVPRHPGGVMDKCDFCLGADGSAARDPRCSRACPTGALRSGTLAELCALANGAAQLLDAPTSPSLLVPL